MKRLFGGVILAMVAGAFVSSGWAEGDAAVRPEIKFFEPLPAVRAAAEREHIPFERIAAPTNRRGLQLGDSVTALVSLVKGEDLSQWLVQMSSVALNEKEQKSPPPQESHIYTSTGMDIKFGGQYVAIAIRVLGPYKKGNNRSDSAKGTKDMKTRVLVNSDNLALGFDRTSEGVFTLRRAMEKNLKEGDPFSWHMSTLPFPASVAKDGRAMIDLLGLTGEQERALAGSFPALVEFAQLALRTPGLQDIMYAVVDVPWWSLIRKGGAVNAGVDLEFSKIYSAPVSEGSGKGRQGYGFPVALQINGKPALSCHVLATSPRPPLVTCAGILGVAAQAPDGKGPFLMVQIVDARCADESKRAE